MRKYCIVPGCRNTSTKMPDKRFIVVPLREKRRKAWFKAIRTNYEYSSKASLVVCEDHFNLEEDVENYIQFKYYDGRYIKLKPSVVPHIFECQPERRAAQPSKGRPLSAKRARRTLVDGLIAQSSHPNVSTDSPQASHGHNNGDTLPAEGTVYTEHFLSTYTHDQWTSNYEGLCSPESCGEMEIHVKSEFPPPESCEEIHFKSEFQQIPSVATPKTEDAVEALCLLSENVSMFSHKAVQVCFSEKDDKVQAHSQVKDKAVAANLKPSYRSKFTQCSLLLGNPFETIRVATSPAILLKPKIFPSPMSDLCAKGSGSSIATKMSTPSSLSSSPHSKDLSGDSEEIFHDKLKQLQKLNVNLCERDPMYYLGLPSSQFHLVNKLAGCIKSNPLNVMICLKMIRLNPSFKGLSYDFDISESLVTEIFEKHVPLLAACMSGLIVWLSKIQIMERLPIPFRAKYSNVQSIIDCFEIEIEKPKDLIEQTLTWSHFEKCNTMKYLISCTPDGCINFVSKGFGGKTSDTKICELSGYLDRLPPKAGVMAFRGFKGIAKELEERKCVLIRLPSVAANTKSQEEDYDRLCKQIASLRIHIERVISSVREFTFLKAHACVSHNHLKYLDCIVKIVCGLINLHEPLLQYV